ncbi:hypothetical protein A9500_03640 [Haemophilus sp. CCUG 60358]|jgi:hypothetical protein|uniref:hypothetical protein n=1 Tax=Haemophilus sp. CCUG 60358 TaxID=1859695 RepID=UPI000803107F|nr:hypothetical protein [Haemophilus sp. CCUG 60358]OBX90982.1 hypothetical protein A9500_03640 [Haemophilus sp. CCUG 60358]
METLKLLNNLYDLVKNDTESNLGGLVSYSIKQIESLSDKKYELCQIYEEKKIIPKIKKILKSIEQNNGVDISKSYNDFIELFSMIESLYFTYIPQMPLIEEFEKKVNDKILKFEDSFSKKDKDFSDKLTSLQTLLGSSQANATQIEGVKNNVISLEARISSIQSEYEIYKNKYIEVEREYEALLSSINADKNRLANSIIELDELKKSKKDELNVLIKELDDEKENIKDILGDANRASMAQSFLARKKELDTPIENSAVWRNIGLLAMSIIILIILASEWEQNSFDYFRFFSRLPVVMPLLWLVWSNSQRNNHLVRVQEEYAYKAAVAIAFEGYQRKVDEINDVDLKKLLLELSVTNMGNNPVNLFDKNTKNSPFEIDKFIEKFLNRNSEK